MPITTTPRRQPDDPGHPRHRPDRSRRRPRPGFADLSYYGGAPLGAHPGATGEALRFAGAALAEGHAVRVHLLRGAVALAAEGAHPEQGELMAELMAADMAVSACGKALDELGVTDADLRPGIERGSMKALAAWTAESDSVLSF
ncbi:DsrE family protein [Thiohalorhabdus sp.]|uniref:DsrE family protein n=1 Tax=Thiohalorhabdus sp. TaxID=3094134 RepID=UPI002FC339A7